jgi:hypothetical protein
LPKTTTQLFSKNSSFFSLSNPIYHRLFNSA